MSKMRHVRRLWPFVLMGYERWQQLPQHKKDAYLQQAKGYADRGRKTIADRSAKRKKA